MLTTFRYQVLSLVRDRTLMCWACAFPIILATIFGIMFAGIEDEYAVSAFRLGVVEGADYGGAPGLDAFLEGMADEDQGYLALSPYRDEESADEGLREGAIDGYLTVDEPWRWDKEDWAPHLHVSPSASISSSTSLGVARAVLDAYVHVVAEFVELGRSNPSAIGALVGEGDMASAEAFFSEQANATELGRNDLSAIGSMMGEGDMEGVDVFFSEHAGTTELVLTKSAPNPSARYYYSLLGMACGLAAMLAISAIRACQATSGALGARRTLAALPRWRVLMGSVLAAWACSFVALLIAFLYLLLVIRVDFGDGVGWCVAAIGMASLMSCAAGAFAGTFAHVETGLVSGITCLLSLFTGLYGTAAQRVADATEVALPWLSALNPLWQISGAFYALLYYDTLGPFVRHCLALGAMTVVFAAAAALRMRSMSHEHL